MTYFAHPEDLNITGRAFEGYELGEKTKLLPNKEVILAAKVFDNGSGIRVFGCETLVAEPERLQNATYMIVVRAVFSDKSTYHADGILHLGLNAEIIEIDTAKHILYVKDIDSNASVFGDRCAIDCTEVIRKQNLLYVNYDAEDDVRSIVFDDFQVGDAVIINLYDSEKQDALNKDAIAEQVQLATQRMKYKSLYELTPIEQIEEKYDNEEFVITKLHYENLDGEWVSEGYTYKYRLEITGRMNNAAKNTTYIVLSNTEDITFDQTWKASGLSSIMADYFDPSVAVIVGNKSFS